MGRRVGDAEETPEIVWLEVALDLWEAQVVEPTGLTVYAGYMARSSGTDPWRGYIGADFAFVASGERVEVRRALEETARTIWAAQRQAIVHTPPVIDATDASARPDEASGH